MYKENSFIYKLKALDVFEKYESKYLKPTLIGAICKKKYIKTI